MVIPAHNEVRTIRNVAERALAQAPLVVVVDDGSDDGTGAAVADLPARVLRNEANQGKGASLWRGMQYALSQGARGVVTLDADGQHAPEDIPRLLAAARAHPGDIVIGARSENVADAPRYRYFANKFANFWLSWACGYRLADSQSGFRFYPAEVLRRVTVPHDRARGFVFESEILIHAARLGVKSVAMPIRSLYLEGQRLSHYRQLDSLRITRMVAASLLSRGLYLPGLVRVLGSRPRRPRP